MIQVAAGARRPHRPPCPCGACLNFRSLVLSFATLAGLCAATQAPLRVGVPAPVELDLSASAGADWVPRDARDPAQVEAARRNWAARVAPYQGAGAVRILLPAGPDRLPMLLAAAQALRAQDPQITLFLGFQPQAPALWDEAAWGAVQGGALLPADLGPDPGRWRERLMEAQNQFPGRPWSLWLPADPGAQLSELMGDGGRLVVPPGGPATRLAEQLPGATEVEGGLGDLTLGGPESGGAAAPAPRRWRFQDGQWVPAPPATGRGQARVTAQAAYDVGALLAHVRATQWADRARARTRQGDLAIDLHLQSDQGPGVDLGFDFRFFEAAGEPEELLQQQVRFNGVKANLGKGLQLPIVESRTGLAQPVALNLTERYRYRDGGPAGPGLRLIRFEPVDPDPRLFTGELRVDEATGRILEERSRRSGLPGMVVSEQRVLSYGDDGTGAWRLVLAHSHERWLLGGAVTPVQRTLRYSGFRTNAPDFLAERDRARASDRTMLRETLEGTRYFNKQADGTRRVEERPRSSGRALGALLLVDPTLQIPVLPLGGLAYFDFDAFGRGIQINALTAVVYNQVTVTVPRVAAGVDLSADSTSLFITSTERPIIQGRLADQQGVGRRFGTLNLTLGRDLGAGWRLDTSLRGQEDVYCLPPETQYRTPGFLLPPSGLTRELRGELSWQHGGLQVAGYLGTGRRPEGTYGVPDALQAVPDQGRFRRWGGHLGYDLQLRGGSWLHGETGVAGGAGFDRFKALSLGGTGGDVRIAGLRSNAIAAEQLTYAKAGVVFPSAPGLRLSLSLDEARFRNLDDPTYRTFTGLGVAGDLPGFGWFTTVRVDLGAGLLSDMPGVRSVNGFVALLRVF